MNDAELRARHQWEARHIQGVAVATAKTTAEMARKKAEEAKSMLSGFSVSAEQKEMMRIQALAAYKEEVAVQGSASWSLQMNTISWIVQQSYTYGQKCSAFKTTIAETKGDVARLQTMAEELKLKSDLTSNP